MVTREMDAIGVYTLKTYGAIIKETGLCQEEAKCNCLQNGKSGLNKLAKFEFHHICYGPTYHFSFQLPTNLSMFGNHQH